MNNFLKTKNIYIAFKRIFLINSLNIIFNNFNRYKPKLLIYKVAFNSYNLNFKFSKFKNICIIQKGIYINNINSILKSLFLNSNKLLLSPNDLRYYILKFPFKTIIKIKKSKKTFIYNKREENSKNLIKIIYCNYLFLNKNKIKLKNKILFKNQELKINIFNSWFLNKNKGNKNFYNLFYLKGYKYLNKINYKYNLTNIKIKKYTKKIINFIFFIINKKNLITFFIYNKKNNLKLSKLFLIKVEENSFFNFNISNNFSIFFYKKNNNSYFKKYSTIKIIYKKIKNNIFFFSKNFNINYKYKNKNYISHIYINFTPFLIENNSFLIQLDTIFNIYSNNSLFIISINKLPNNI